jgi:hypothetical protein
MSATFQAAAKALSENPDLLANVMAAGSAEERQAHLRAAGVTVPTHADLNSHMANVAGGWNSGYDPMIETGATIAAGAAAAAA